MTKYSISVVLPAFNEEDNIETMVEHAVSALKNLDLQKYEIIVVDDGSADKTGKIADSLAEKHKGILRVVHHERNKGYADALKTGFKNTRYPLVFYTDSDLQFNMNELRPFLDKIDKYDIVCGYRKKRKDPIHRILIARIYNKMINIIFDLSIRDIDCAFKIFKKKVFDSVKIESKGFLVDLEIISKAKQKGFTVTEVPVTHYKRSAGSSTLTPGSIFKTIRGIFWLKRRLNAEKN